MLRRRRSINNAPRASKPRLAGSGVFDSTAGYGKLFCQIRKSSPSTFPSPVASPIKLIAAPSVLGKLFCQIRKSLPSISPSPSKSPWLASSGWPEMKLWPCPRSYPIQRIRPPRVR